MKHQTRKLVVRRETIKTLESIELGRVAGAAATLPADTGAAMCTTLRGVGVSAGATCVRD